MTNDHPQSHAPQIVALIVTGVMCFIAGVLSNDMVSLLTSKMSAEQAKPERTIAASKPAETAATAKTSLVLIESIDSKSSDPVQQRALSLFTEGVRLQKSGEHADAINKYIAVTELDPGMAAAFNNLAVAYASLQSPDQAAANLAKAADIAPKDEAIKKNVEALNASLTSGRQ